MRLIFATGRLRNHRRGSDAEHLCQRQHNHHQIPCYADSSDRFLAEVPNPIKIGEEVERLHQHADGEE